PVLMLMPFKHVLFKRIVLDVYDSIIKRRAGNALVAWCFRTLRWLANAASDRIIETSEELRETLGSFSKKAVVIYNSPSDPHGDTDGIYPEKDAPIQLAVSGSIDCDGMPLKTLVSVLDELGPTQIRVQSTGFLKDDFARKQWANHPCVTHRWLDKPADYF